MEKVLLFLPLLLVSVGCASQKSVDDLSKQLADVNARLTKMELASTQQSHDKIGLERAMDLAKDRRLNCRARAESAFNRWLRQNGTPVKGQKGVYNVGTEGSKQARDEENKADADCQKEYEDDLQAAKLKYSE